MQIPQKARANCAGFGLCIPAASEGSVGGQQQRADDSGGDGVGQGRGEALLEDAVHGFGVEQDLQHRRDAGPADHVGRHLAQVEADQVLPVRLGGIQVDHIGQHAQQPAEGGGGDDPAPGHGAGVQVDEDVAQQTGQRAGQGPEGHGQEAQQAILQTDVDGLNGAGDHDEGAQQEEQHCADADDGGFTKRNGFHGRPPDGQNVSDKYALSYPFFRKKSMCPVYSRRMVIERLRFFAIFRVLFQSACLRRPHHSSENPGRTSLSCQDECPKTHIIYHEVLDPYVLEQIQALARSMKRSTN